jgi:hypothetical protein
MHLASETGQWHVGLTRVLYGVRVIGSRGDSGFRSFNYCAGADPSFASRLLVVMIVIMESFPESVTEREVEDLLPSFERKPIDRDPCWDKLQELARKVTKMRKLKLTENAEKMVIAHLGELGVELLDAMGLIACFHSTGYACPVLIDAMNAAFIQERSIYPNTGAN